MRHPVGLLFYAFVIFLEMNIYFKKVSTFNRLGGGGEKRAPSSGLLCKARL